MVRRLDFYLCMISLKRSEKQKLKLKKQKWMSENDQNFILIPTH